MSERQICIVCGMTRDNHAGKKHTFNPPGVRVDVSQFNRKPVSPPPVSMPGVDRDGRVIDAPRTTHVQFPFDPILRMALINKGLLTHDDLILAEQQMHAVSGSAWVREAGNDELVKAAGDEDTGSE